MPQIKEVVQLDYILEPDDNGLPKIPVTLNAYYSFNSREPEYIEIDRVEIQMGIFEEDITSGLSEQQLEDITLSIKGIDD